MPWPTVVSRTVSLPDRRAKLRLESAVWSGLDEIARKQLRPVQELCKDVDAHRPPGMPLTSAIRTYVLDYFRQTEAR
ncbi:ribbon-helix-helix domain-containing protein [Azospirillum doebereinerae]